MRHATSQLADDVHLLRMPQLVLEAFALADVAPDGVDDWTVIVLGHDRRQQHFHGERFAVRARMHPFESMVGRLDGALHVFVGLIEGALPVGLVFRGDLGRVGAQQRCSIRVAQHLYGCGVAVDEDLILDDQDGVG